MKLLLNRVISKIDRSFNDDHKSIQIDDILKKNVLLTTLCALCLLKITLQLNMILILNW